MKGIKEDLSKWRDITCSYIRRLDRDIDALQIVLYRFNAIKITARFSF